VDLMATPITDLKQPAPGVDIGLLEGAVNNTSTEAVARRMRRCCKTLVAFGDCAVFGGIVTLRNRVRAADALRRAYIEAESTVDGRIPRDEELAVVQEARPVADVVTVDVNLPGCPPSADAIEHVLGELAAGRIPALRGPLLAWH